MKTFTTIIVSFLFTCIAYAVDQRPAWHRVEGKPIGFFKDKGFEFSVDDSMARHYEKPTVEVSISIPGRFTDSDLTNEFSSAIILNDDISTDLGTHPYAGKRRIILTISEAMTRKSQVIFYFRNKAKDVTDGAMYVLDLTRVVDDWKNQDKKLINKVQVTYAGGDGSSYEQAVIIKGAKDEEAGIAAENAWLAQTYPRFRKELQSLMSSGGRHYDLIEITTSQGQKRIYFDITDFFGK